jgi:uncharacterized protein YoxC
MTADIRNIAFACLAIALAGCAVLLTHDVHSLTGAAHGTLNNVNAATGTLADYARDESTLLRSPKNQAALDAAVQLGGVFNGSGRLLNTQVIPRAMKTLDGLTAETASLKFFTDNLTATTTGKGGLLPTATTSLASLGSAVEQVETDAEDADVALKKASDRLGVDETQLKSAISDTRVQRFFDDLSADSGNIVKITGSLAGITGNLEQASKDAPVVADLWAKMMKTSSKWQKYLYMARIIAYVYPAFFSPLIVQ